MNKFEYAFPAEFRNSVCRVFRKKISKRTIMELNKRTIPQQLMISADTWPSAVAQYSKDDEGNFQPTTYPQLVEQMFIAASGFLEHGIVRDDLVGLISENRKE